MKTEWKSKFAGQTKKEEEIKHASAADFKTPFGK